MLIHPIVRGRADAVMLDTDGVNDELVQGAKAAAELEPAIEAFAEATGALEPVREATGWLGA